MKKWKVVTKYFTAGRERQNSKGLDVFMLVHSFYASQKNGKLVKDNVKFIFVFYTFVILHTHTHTHYIFNYIMQWMFLCFHLLSCLIISRNIEFFLQSHKTFLREIRREPTVYDLNTSPSYNNTYLMREPYATWDSHIYILVFALDECRAGTSMTVVVLFLSELTSRRIGKLLHLPQQWHLHS